MIELPHQLGRESEHAQSPPGEGVPHPEQHRDRHEQGGAQPQVIEPRKPQPQGEADQRQPHRKREIDESEQEREIVGEGRREQGGGRNPPVHLIGDPEQPADGERRNGEHDQLHRRFQPDQGRQRLDQEVDAEIADHRPFEAVILLEVGSAGEVELDPVAPHMARQVEQGRHVRPEQWKHGKQHDREHEVAPLPEGAWGRSRRRSVLEMHA